MLQSAKRTREEAETTHAATRAPDMKRSARRLNEALARLENAAVRRPAPALADAQALAELREENARLGEAGAALREENEALLGRLSEMQEKHREVAGQVVSLSTRLEMLIERLGKVLEE